MYRHTILIFYICTHICINDYNMEDEKMFQMSLLLVCYATVSQAVREVLLKHVAQVIPLGPHWTFLTASLFSVIC